MSAREFIDAQIITQATPQILPENIQVTTKAGVVLGNFWVQAFIIRLLEEGELTFDGYYIKNPDQLPLIRFVNLES